MTTEATATVAAAPDAAKEAEEKKQQRMDVLFGVTLAVFAAVLAVCDLGGGKYGDDEILANNSKTEAYNWFSDKSIKAKLVEGQADLEESMLKYGALDPKVAPAIEADVAAKHKKIARYNKEKNEILLGSAKVGKENWVQDIDGQLGQVIGAKQWEDRANKLGAVGDVFDLGTLYMQMCLVLGAIGIVVKADKLKWAFYALMLITGVAGSTYTYMAFTQAWAIQ
jgi:hypothetical protein